MSTFHNPPNKQLTIAVYAVAIALRIALVIAWGAHSPQIYDAQEYLSLAEQLVETGHFANENGELVSLRPPLYPALVAVTFHLFGMHNYTAMAVLQSILGIATMVITHKTAVKIRGPWAGLFAAIVIGVYPSLVAFNCLLLTETLFTLILALAIYFSLQLQSSANFWFAVSLGLCLGLGSLTRSILYVCTPPVLLLLLITGSGSMNKKLVNALAAFVTCGVIIAPWSYRNTQIQKTSVIIDVMGGRNVMMGNYEFTPLERSWATVSDVTGEKSWGAVLRKSMDTDKELTQGQLDKEAMRYGIKYFFSNPKITFQRCAIRFFNFWQLERTIPAGIKKGIWGESSKLFFTITTIAIAGSYAFLLFLSLQGIFSGGIALNNNLLMLLWIALPCAIHTIAFAHSRYHLPLIPVLACYAGLYIDKLFLGFKETRLKDFFSVRALFLFGVFLLAWIRELIYVDLHHL